MKVLCIGDSLALPGHLNKYEDTWFFKLKQEYPQYDFISFFKRQLTTDVLTSMGGGEAGIDQWPKGADCLEAYLPDILIIQLGIVDCAPRLLNIYDRILLKFMPNNFAKSYIKVIKYFRKRKTQNTIVSFEKFQQNWINYLNRTIKINARVIIVSISLPNQTFLAKNPEALINVKRYNAFLFQLTNNFNNVLITSNLNPNNYDQPIYEDGYHPNHIGHNILLNEIKKLFKIINE